MLPKLTTLPLIMIFILGQGAQAEDAKHRFTDKLIKYQVLAEADHGQDKLDLAWTHQAALQEMVQNNRDLFPEVLPDGEISTANNMGYNWGYGPAITVELDHLLQGSETRHLLEIGPCYGLDSIALASRYPQLQITAVEIDPKHVKLMKEMVQRTLPVQDRSRIEVHQGDFLEADKLALEPAQYDVAVVSKVLHFYDEDHINQFLAKLYPLMKPGGVVVLSHISDRGLSFTGRLATSIGAYIPSFRNFVSGILCRGPNLQGYLFTPEDMQRLAGSAGFHVIRNEYLGSLYEKRAASSWLPGGAKLKESTLYTVLQRPAE